MITVTGKVTFDEVMQLVLPRMSPEDTQKLKDHLWSLTPEQKALVLGKIEKFRLEAVGIDLDGKIKPLAELSYLEPNAG